MGILTATPSIVTILNVAAGPVVLNVSTTNSIGPISATLADGSFCTLSSSSIAGSSGSLTITPTNEAGGDDVLSLDDGVQTLLVPIALGASALPTNPGEKTLTQAIAYVRIMADAPTSPSDANMTLLLNEALLEVGDALASVLNMVSLPITLGTPTVTLPADILDIEKIGYSTNLPNVPGAIPYELVELGPGPFMDFNAGVAGSYGFSPAGPVLYYCRLQDSFGRIRIMFAPLPPEGYLNITYHARVSLFDVNNPASVVSLDQSYFELVTLITSDKVCLAQRDTTRAKMFRDRYNELLATKKMSVGRRNNARVSVVRDVTSSDYNALPTWFPQ